MSLPKPLVIVLVIVVLLGVIGCGVSVALSSEQGMNDDQRKVELNGGIASLFKRFAPPSEPVQLVQGDVSCTLSTASLEVPGSCGVDVPPTDAPRRQLLLRPTSGAMLMFVTVTHDGEENSDSLFVASNSDEGSVVLTPGDSAEIVLSCSCTVLVNP